MAKLIPAIVFLLLGSGAHGVGSDVEMVSSPVLNKYGNPVTGYFVDHNVPKPDDPRFGFELDESGKLSMYLDYPGLPPEFRRTVSLENGVGRYANAKGKWVFTVKEGGFRSIQVRMETEQIGEPLIKFELKPVTFEAMETERWTPNNDSALLTYTSKKFGTKAELLASMREKMTTACSAYKRVVDEKATVCQVSYPSGSFNVDSETQYFECVLVYLCH